MRARANPELGCDNAAELAAEMSGHGVGEGLTVGTMETAVQS